MNIFNYLSNEELDKYTYIINYKSSDIVFNEGKVCERVGLIIFGEIKIITLTHTEKEETINLLKNNDYFGDILTFSTTSNYLGHGICLKETCVRYISKSNLLYLCSINQDFLEAFLCLISTKALNLKQENKLFKHKNIRDRIMHYLSSQNFNNFSGKIYISNISNLSRILSLPRPSVSREISSMIEDGIILKDKDLFGTYIKIIKRSSII